MLLVFNGVLCLTLISTLIQLSDTIHYPYIAKGAGMRTLKRYYHIGIILAVIIKEPIAFRAPRSIKQTFRQLDPLLWLRGAAESWRSNNPQGVRDIIPFYTFLFMTKYDLAAMLLLGIYFKSIGGSGIMWIR